MNSLLSVKHIKTVRYISLKSDFIKRCLLRTQLRSLPCEKKWIPGVKYDANNSIYDKYTKNGFESYLSEGWHPRRRGGVAGCWIAHSHALESITDCDGISIILEDDFVCKPGFFNKAIKMLSEFEQEFDIIIFDPSGTGPLQEHCISKDIYANNGGVWPVYWGTHCLFINNKSISKIIDTKLNSQISDYDGYLLTNSKLKIYLFYSHMCTANDFGSNINRSSPIFSILKYLFGIYNWLKCKKSKSSYMRRVY